jgi:microcystin degradation protein MlrC
MRLFTAGLSHESNTFSPIPTGLTNFTVFRGAGDPGHPTAFSLPLQIWHKRAEERGWQVSGGLAATATPSGTVARKAYEYLRDQILSDLNAAMPVDAVLLNLHGAMVADGYDDCEGDLISRIRQRVRARVPIGAELDPHCHMTELMTQNATGLICFKETPHTDMGPRAEELFSLILDAQAGRTRPRMALWDTRMLEVFWSTLDPYKRFVDKIKALEGKDRVLSISTVHGFCFGDVPGFGTQMLVITDDDADGGARLAEQLGRELIALRGWRPPFVSLDEGLAGLPPKPVGRPVVMADPADNPGGGEGGDNTRILRGLVERGVTAAAVATIWDPVAVMFAHAAGLGARFPLRLGGKTGPMAGQPLDLEVEVIGLTDDLVQRYSGVEGHLGAAAGLRCGGVEISVAAIRNQVRSPDVFRNVGIDPMSKRLLVVKSANHFRAEFEPIASEILYCADPFFYTNVPYKRIRRPRWPMDPHTFDTRSPTAA